MVKKVGSDEGVTRYAYDGMDRLTHVEYPDGRVVDYAFDDLGNRARTVEILDPAGQDVSQTTYTYDAGSRLLTAETVSGGDSRTVLQFGYEANGNQVARAELAYDGDSRLGDASWTFHFHGLNETLSYVWDGQDVVAGGATGSGEVGEGT